MAHTFKAPVSVWINQYSSHDAESLQHVKDARNLIVWADGYEPPKDYTRVGFGTVEITIASKDEIIQGKVETLRAQLEQDRADSQQRQNALIRKISELEALTFDAEAA